MVWDLQSLHIKMNYQNIQDTINQICLLSFCILVIWLKAYFLVWLKTYFLFNFEFSLNVYESNMHKKNLQKKRLEAPGLKNT